MKRKALCFILFLVIFMKSYANDTSYYIAGGNIIPAEQNRTNVELREETINIVLFDDYYTVTVDFIFYNNGQDENLLVGFPYLLQKQGGGTITSINNFRTWVNNSLVEHSNNSIEINEQGRSERIVNYAFTKNVYFPSRKVTEIRVQYNADYGREPYQIIASYYYGSGRSWDKSIGKITIYLENKITKFDAWIYDFEIPNINTTDYIRWNGDIMEVVLENVEPDDDDLFQIYLANRLWDYYPPLITSADNFRGRVGVLNKKTLSLLSRAQLRLLLNSFYALYGYNFRDENLREIFMDVFGWFYHVNENFNETLITDKDRNNINMILEEERNRQ